MTIAKTPSHLAADEAFATATTRAEKARAIYTENDRLMADVLSKRDALLAESAAGRPVTAAQIREIEDQVRDLESKVAFLKAASDGAATAWQSALAELRESEKLWFLDRHAGLMARRAAVAREADELIEQVRMKIREAAAVHDDFESLRREADTSTCAPHTKGVPPFFHFLPPVAQIDGRFRIVIIDANGSAGPEPRGSVTAALGHGNLSAAA